MTLVPQFQIIEIQLGNNIQRKLKVITVVIIIFTSLWSLYKCELFMYRVKDEMALNIK